MVVSVGVLPARFHAIVVWPEVHARGAANKIRLNGATLSVAVIARRVSPAGGCHGDVDQSRILLEDLPRRFNRDDSTVVDWIRVALDREVLAFCEADGVVSGDLVGFRHILVSSGFAFDMRSKAYRLRGRNNYFCIGANFFSAATSAEYVETLGV